MNHYLLLLSSEWSLPPISPLQNRAIGWISDTSKHLCARCAASHVHEHPKPFSEFTAEFLPGVRQTRRCTIHKWHDAASSSFWAFEQFPSSNGRDRRQLQNPRQRGDVALSAAMQWQGLVATLGSRCNACRPELHPLGHQMHELPSLWALFAQNLCWKPNSATIPLLPNMKEQSRQ